MLRNLQVLNLFALHTRIVHFESLSALAPLVCLTACCTLQSLSTADKHLIAGALYHRLPLVYGSDPGETTAARCDAGNAVVQQM